MYMYIYIYIHMYICVYIYIYIHTYTYLCIYVCIFIYTYTYTYTYTYISLPLYISLYIYLSLSLYIYIYTDIQTFNGPDSSVVRAYGLGSGRPWVRSSPCRTERIRVSPFKVSGGSPRPPPEQTPVVQVKTPRVSKKLEIQIYTHSRALRPRLEPPRGGQQRAAEFYL